VKLSLNERVILEQDDLYVIVTKTIIANKNLNTKPDYNVRE
jgi:hypothetical protein